MIAKCRISEGQKQTKESYYKKVAVCPSTRQSRVHNLPLLVSYFSINWNQWS